MISQLSVSWRAKLRRALFFHKKDWTTCRDYLLKTPLRPIELQKTRHLWQRSITRILYKIFKEISTDIAVNSYDPTPVSGIYRTLVRIKSIINAFALILILRKREWPWDKILDEVLMGSISAVGSLGEASHRLGNTSALENSQAPGNCPPNPVEIGKWQLFQVIALKTDRLKIFIEKLFNRWFLKVPGLWPSRNVFS